MEKCKAIFYKIAYPVAKLSWFFIRPNTQGVRCIVLCGEDILLIKHTYGSPLRTTVGGGINRGETEESAVIREVKEEVGLNLYCLSKVGEVIHTKEFKNDTVHVFVARTHERAFIVDGSEIKEVAWFKFDELPSDTSPLFIEFYKLARPFIEAM